MYSSVEQTLASFTALFLEKYQQILVYQKENFQYIHVFVFMYTPPPPTHKMYSLCIHMCK